MKKNKRDPKSSKLTVLLLDHHFTSEKTLQIPHQLIRHWKYYLLALVCLFLVLIGTVVFIASQNKILNEDSVRLQSKLDKVKEYPKKMEAVQNKILKLEAKMAKVAAYLSQRGVKQSTVEGGREGGKGGIALDLTDENMEEVIDQYMYFVDTLHRNLSNLPIGYPIYGQLTSLFGVRTNPFSEVGYEVHPGVDIQAKWGAKVKAPAHGKIVFADWRGGYGKCIIIKHNNGFQTLYGHLSAIKVREGQEVNAGEVIGEVGSTGRSTGPHLHYEITQNGKRINPSLFLKNN